MKMKDKGKNEEKNKDSKNNNSNLSLWLSVISLVGVVAFAVLWICNVRPQSVVSLDSFVGVATGLIGIMVTFAIGWQIFNAMELKSKITELEQLKDRVQNQQEDLMGVAYISRAETCQIMATFAIQNGNILLAFQSFQNAVLADVSAPPKYAKYTSVDLISLSKILPHIPSCPTEAESQQAYKATIKQIQEIESRIRQAPLFNMIQAQYDAIMSEFYKKVSYEE